MGYPFISIHIEKYCHFYKKNTGQISKKLPIGKVGGIFK